MDWRAICAAVIPCLNEERSIGEVVNSVRQYLNAVVVIDDGSRDATAARAAEAGAVVLGQQPTRGKGAALRAGLRESHGRGFQWALTLDGDGQHPADSIPRFFACAEQTGAMLVVGNRMGQPAPMPWLRRLVNRWMSRRLSRAAGKVLPDSQCGFRLLNLHALTKVPLVTNHFEIESEMLLGFIRAGYCVEFVPVPAIYKAGGSKIHPLRDSLRWSAWWRGARRL